MAEAKENLGFRTTQSASGDIRTNPTSGAHGALLDLVETLPAMALRARFKQEANALRGALCRYQKNGKHPVHRDLCDLRAFVRYLLTDPKLGPHPGGSYSLDRIDPSRGYEPGNLRWATKSQQSLNRPTTPKMVTQHGEELPVSTVAKRRKKVTAATALTRHKRGWSPEEATSLPKHTRRASVKGQRAAPGADTSTRAAWGVWSSAFQETFGAPALGWGSRERGQMKHLLARLEEAKTDPLPFLRYAVESWRLITDHIERGKGRWNTKPPPPASPEPGFLSACLHTFLDHWRQETIWRYGRHPQLSVPHVMRHRLDGLSLLAAEKVIALEQDYQRHVRDLEAKRKHLAEAVRITEMERARLAQTAVPVPHRHGRTAANPYGRPRSALLVGTDDGADNDPVNDRSPVPGTTAA